MAGSRQHTRVLATKQAAHRRRCSSLAFLQLTGSRLPSVVVTSFVKLAVRAFAIFGQCLSDESCSALSTSNSRRAATN